MKAVRYEAPGNMAVTDVPMPTVGPLDVRIKIHQSGSVAQILSYITALLSAPIR
jgi:NADPH:quinone reductase-like Zn-dependent oxidoreductase